MDAPQAPVCRAVLSLLESFEQHAASWSALAEEDRGQRFPGVHLMVAAAVVALTPDVALPAEPRPGTAVEPAR